ncbi:MAG: hypothetical protein ACFFBD_20340 [Candidatus Hodarchaeota archaeon]
MFHTKHYTPQQFFKPLELASITNLSITDACTYYRSQNIGYPSSELLLKRCREVNSDRIELYIGLCDIIFATRPRKSNVI